MEIITDWVSVGFALIIASLSQWRTLSLYHLYLCVNFSCFIPVTWQDSVERGRDRLLAIYFMSYTMLRVAITSYFIYRSERSWSNAPGQCFIMYEGGTGSPDEVSTLTVWMGLFIVRDVFSIISVLAKVFKASRGQRAKLTASESQDVKAVSTDIHMTQDTGVCNRRTQRLGFLFSLVVTCSQYITNVTWAAGITRANRTHISGDEHSFTFGQVTAVVTLVATFYKIVTSCLSKTCAPS